MCAWQLLFIVERANEESTSLMMRTTASLWSKIDTFQKGLTAMFAQQEDVVFMETYINSTKRKAPVHVY